MAVKDVGFIGLGIMGKPMAKNLLKADFSLTIVGNRAKQAVEELKPMGVTVVDTPKEVAENSEIIVTCLPDSPDVELVCLGENGILDGAKEGLIVIDMSTISPIVAQSVAAELAKKGVKFLDAPVSGGQTGAIEGTLSVMIGGEADAVEKSMDVLNAMGKKIVHIGGSGTGQFTKAANQIICAVTWQAIGEGMTLAAKAGADPAKVLEAISAGAARCWALEVRAPRMLKGDFEPGFMAKLQYKDLNIALNTGKEIGVPLPVTSIVTEFYRAIMNDGKADDDTSALVTLTEKLAGVEIRSES